MGETIRKFNILLWKNHQVRKKHLKKSIFFQFLYPLGLTFFMYFTLQIFSNLDSNVKREKLVLFTPNSSDTIKLMEQVKTCSNKTFNITTAGYKNEQEMSNVMANMQSIGIIFKNESSFEYKLRVSNNSEFNYEIENCLNNSIKNININTTENYLNRLNKKIFETWNYLIFLIIFMSIFGGELEYIINEKINGINVLMSLNGVSNWLNLSSWLVSGAMWGSITLLFSVIIAWFFGGPFIKSINPVIFFIALLLNFIQFMCCGYHLASYLNIPWKSKALANGSILLLYMGPFLHYFMAYEQSNRLYEYLKIINPFSCLMGITNELNSYRIKGDVIGFINIFLTGSNTDPFEASIGMTMIFSIFGAILHFVMTLYIQAIRPGKHGVKRHPFAWFMKKNKLQNNQIQLDSYNEYKDRKEFEKITDESLKPGIQIRNLKKIYKSGFLKKNKFHALNGVSVDFYQSQITALLGHNGAGKTTMMSILSGLTNTSDGDVLINGKNIVQNPDYIKDNVGFCPQFNITIPDLNVYQQVLFFGKLNGKNKTTEQIEEDVESLFSIVNLLNKKICMPDKLSGGQQRRLSLAMAIIGDAKVLIFDEPTSGIDTEGKRDIWNMILKIRNHKTILISTHDMEEADILGDRIAIMHSGKLYSYGTTMFLKKLYGDGQVEVTLSLESNCDTSKILEITGKNIKILNNKNNTIELAIPNSETLPETLDKLEFSKKKLGITGISVSLITLERVFIKISKEADVNTENTTDEMNNELELFDRNTEFTYFMQKLKGFLIKKYAYAMHNSCSFILRLIVPCLLVLLLSLLSYLPKELDKKIVVVYGSGIIISFSMIILLALYVRQPLEEIKNGIKHLQIITGASKSLYWISIFIADFTHYMITMLLILASLLLVDNILDTQIYNAANIMMYLLLSMLSGLAGLFSVYVFSLFKFSELTSIKWLIYLPVVILKILIPIMVLIIFFDCPAIILVAIKILLLIPQVNFGYAIYCYYRQIIYKTGSTLWNFEVINNQLPLPYYLIIFIISFIIFVSIIIIVEKKIITKLLQENHINNSIVNTTTTTKTDELVLKEKTIVNEEIKKRINKTIEHNNENVFLAHELKKNYGNLQVVNDISFRVKTGECFGLLGVNGAGKSTTFKILTNQEISRDGMMYLKDIGMHENCDKYLSNMGYCPQNNALIETLNAWDHLCLFARLRGIPESLIKSTVENWIKRLNLSSCAYRPSKTYSGGNKRRLNIAMSLIGKPSLVLMDEPTTGVDPAARRSIWNTLKLCQNSGLSIILTSHSMEECEALCNRLVIMVNGKLVCVGAVQELKQRFGAGYNIHIKLSSNTPTENVKNIKETIESSIDCEIINENIDFIGYHVTDPGATWTIMYRMMNTLKNDYNCIEDFAVLSSTLEQLFIKFAKGESTVLNINI